MLSFRLNYLETDMKPTYLYIKQHRVTGLLYFGKTESPNPIKYQGQGDEWNKHLNLYGRKEVDTLWYCLYHDQQDITNFAKMFSTQQDIVKSTLWANQRAEHGMSGGSPKGWKHKSTAKGKIATSLIGNQRALGTIQSTEANKARSDALLGVPCPQRARAGKLNGNYGKVKEEVTCPYCNATGKSPNVYRYHFNNCKNRGI